MSDISSASYSLHGPYALGKQHVPSMSANYTQEKHPRDEGGDWAPIGTTVLLPRNRVAVKVQTSGAGGTIAPSITCSITLNVASSATGGNLITMNEASCSAARRIWVRTNTNLV